MKKIIIFFIIIICAISFSKLMAQIDFVSNNLSETYSKLPLNCKNSLNKTGATTNCNFGQESIPVKIQYNSQGQVIHLGVSLFDFEYNLVYPSALLAFVERYALSYFINDALSHLNKKNIESRIAIRVNKENISTVSPVYFSKIKQIFSQKNLTTNIRKNEKLFLIEIIDRQNTLEILIPANYELVSGLDKSEYGLQIQQHLSTMKNQTSHESYQKPTKKLTIYSDWLYLDKRGEYFKNISADTYYVCKEIDSCSPVLEKDFLLESIQNALLLPITSDKIQLQINQRLYGNQQLDYVVSLRQFVEFFITDHNLYFGFESEDQVNIIGTLIIAHEKLNYINLLHVSFKSEEFFSGKETFITGKLYTNIPSDNLKNLFAEFK